MTYANMQIQDTIFERFAKDVQAQRTHGRVIVALLNRPKTHKIAVLLDELTAQLKLATLGEKWRELKAPAAQDLLTHALAFDLTYEEEVLPPDQALVLAERFINYFGKHARYFANAHMAEGELADLSPISSTGHDAGVICIEGEKMAVLWIVDEE